MKKYLILVKHSILQIIKGLPANQWKLSMEGQVRAAKLAERLGHYQPEVIVSSNEPKAKETAEIIARKYQSELQVIDNLHEHDRTGEPYISQDKFHVSVQQFFRKPGELVFGKETANQAHVRFSQSVQSVLNSYPSKTVVVVAHGTVISLFVSRLTGISEMSLWNELGLPSFVIVDLGSNTLIAKENII